MELAHAAKLNLGSEWGIGESGVPGPHDHRSGVLAGTGFVAVVGPDEQRTGVLQVAPLSGPQPRRSANMLRFACAALDLMPHLQQVGEQESWRESIEKARLGLSFSVKSQ